MDKGATTTNSWARNKRNPIDVWNDGITVALEDSRAFTAFMLIAMLFFGAAIHTIRLVGNLETRQLSVLSCSGTRAVYVNYRAKPAQYLARELVSCQNATNVWWSCLEDDGFCYSSPPTLFMAHGIAFIGFFALCMGCFGRIKSLRDSHSLKAKKTKFSEVRAIFEEEEHIAAPFAPSAPFVPDEMA